MKARGVALAVCLSACKAAERSQDAGLPPVASTSASAPERAPPHPIFGEWERQTEPYKGMRIAFRPDAPTQALVTAPAPVTQERLSLEARSAPIVVAKARLECQRSLWKPGDELIAGVRDAGTGTFDATILVRDWGFTGACRHVDSRAPAHLVVSAGGDLTIEVTRGKTVVEQQWTRVGR